MKLDKHLLQLGLFFLALPLCGCASSKLSVPKAGKAITPGMARIHFKRAYSIVGAAGAFYVLDRGTGVKYDTVLGAGADAKDEPTMFALTQEKPEIAKCIALRGAKPETAVGVDPTTGVPKPVCRHRDIIGREIYIHEAGTLSGRANTALIGKIGPGATLTWDRPPGVAQFHVDVSGKSSATLPVEAGKEYSVIFHYIGGSYDMKEGR